MANFSIDSIRPNKASQEIETCLQANKVSDVIHQSLLSYLLYSGSINNNLDGISYQDILDGNIKVTQNTIRTVQDVLNEELWEKLKKVGQHYSVEDLESAAMFITRKIDTLGGTLQHGPTTPVSLRRIIKELLNIQPEDRVADVGCGSGNVMFYLADYEPQASYFGYEISMNIAAIAGQRCQELRFKLSVRMYFFFQKTNNSTRYLFMSLLAADFRNTMAERKNISISLEKNARSCIKEQRLNGHLLMHSVID